MQLSDIWGAKEDPPYVPPLPPGVCTPQEIVWLLDHLNEWVDNVAKKTLYFSDDNVMQILETKCGFYQALRNKNIPYWSENDEKMEMLLGFRRLVLQFEDKREGMHTL